jgi:hypothetical protein
MGRIQIKSKQMKQQQGIQLQFLLNLLKIEIHLGLNTPVAPSRTSNTLT